MACLRLPNKRRPLSAQNKYTVRVPGGLAFSARPSIRVTLRRRGG
jgi:hypothetical protein